MTKLITHYLTHKAELPTILIKSKMGEGVYQYIEKLINQSGIRRISFKDLHEVKTSNEMRLFLIDETSFPMEDIATFIMNPLPHLKIIIITYDKKLSGPLVDRCCTLHFKDLQQIYKSDIKEAMRDNFSSNTP